MANFNTHLTYAAVGSGLFSVLFLQVGLISQSEALALALTGTIGGILPDVDLKRSYPSQILFGFFALIIAFSMVFLYDNKLTVIELWLIGGISFFIVRYPIASLFHNFTRHRGSIHSFVAALLAAFITVILMDQLFHSTPLLSWFFGFFMFFGFIIHLLLDELYSVDFSNRRIKRSFGTAMKLIDTRSPFKAILLIALTLVSWALTPSARGFWDTLISYETYQIIGYRMIPDYIMQWL